MEKLQFRNTDLKVTPLCLGTVNYGTDLPEKDAISQLEVYTGMGGNFIDTAHLYGDWQPGWGPRSEIAIGKWLKSFPRDRVVISTKGAHPRMETMQIPRCSNEEIESDLNGSLSVLNTDYVDLYFLHRDDPRRPAGEIIEFLESQVQAGKIRYYGCSNWSLARLKEANEYAAAHGCRGFVSNQLMWSLADIRFDGLSDKTFILMDRDTYAYHREAGINTMAYMSIAKGYFSKRFEGAELPERVRAVYDGQTNEEIFSLLKEACADGRCTPMDYALRYLMDSHPFPSTPIASFSSDAQLKAGMASMDAPVDPAVMEKLRQIKLFRF